MKLIHRLMAVLLASKFCSFGRRCNCTKLSKKYFKYLLLVGERMRTICWISMIRLDKLINLFKHDRFLNKIKKNLNEKRLFVYTKLVHQTEKRCMAKNVESTRQFVEFAWRRPQIVFIEIRTNCRSRFFGSVDIGRPFEALNISCLHAHSFTLYSQLQSPRKKSSSNRT